MKTDVLIEETNGEATKTRFCQTFRQKISEKSEQIPTDRKKNQKTIEIQTESRGTRNAQAIVQINAQIKIRIRLMISEELSDEKSDVHCQPDEQENDRR